MSMPPPPPGGSFAFDKGNQVSTKQVPRRPQVWVPPVIIFGAFAAGYGIPWNLGENPGPVLLRIVFPLIISATICGVAGFYSYRTVPGWRTWTWISFGAMTFNGLSFLLLPALAMPVLVPAILWISNIGLFICALLGPEKNSALYQQPTISNPGFRT
jgi:hypothetical protein